MNTSIYGWHLPPVISLHGPAIDHIINVVHVFAIILFTGWGIFMAYCLIRFRARPGHKANYELPHSKAPKILEGVVVAVEVFFLVGLSFPIWGNYRGNFPDKAEAVEVRIVAQQFVWNIWYPGVDGKFGKADPKLVSDSNPVGIDTSDPNSADDIITLNDFHFPVDKPVITHLSSKDVIHSFYMPVMRVKQDMIPGMSIPVWFQAIQTGTYEIGCAQLCGNGHTRMKGMFTVESPEAFQSWLSQQPTVKQAGI